MMDARTSPRTPVGSTAKKAGIRAGARGNDQGSSLLKLDVITVSLYIKPKHFKWT